MRLRAMSVMNTQVIPQPQKMQNKIMNLINNLC